MEIVINLDKKYIKDIKKKLGIRKTDELISNSLSFLNWFLQETEKGRKIVSKNKDGSDPLEIIFP